MQLRSSLLLTLSGQAYMTLLAVALVPVLERRMGAEAYGLVAFFSMLFAAFHVLDLGLTPLVQREVARLHAQAIAVEVFQPLWRAFGWVFAGIAITGSMLVALGAEALVQRWLNLNGMPVQEAKHAVMLMGMAIALRWWSGLYRGAVAGSERMAWLAGFNAVMVTLRFAGVLVCMHWLGYNVAVFFVYQLAVAMLEWVWLALKARAVLPKSQPDNKSSTGSFNLSTLTLSPLKPLWRMGLAGALAACAGALLMQADKLLLSGLLPLGDFGHFSMALQVATVVMVVGAPVGTVLMPRLARLCAEGHEQDLVQVYRMGTRLISCLALGGGLTMAYCAHPLLTAWTGDAAWASDYWPVLAMYSVGYGFWAVGSVVYCLQYARGELHWYALGIATTLLLWLVIVMGAVKFGGVMAVAFGWLVLTAAYLVLWPGWVHTRYQSGLSWQWLSRDVLSMNWPVLLGIAAMYLLDWQPQSRRESMAYLVVEGGALIAMNVAWWAWTEREHWARWKNGA